MPGVGEAHRSANFAASRGFPSPAGLLEEYRPQPHDRGALLDGDGVVLRGAHRELRAGRGRPRARAGPRSAGGSASGSSANGGMPISPVDADRRALEERRQLVRGDPGLARPRRATLTSTRISVSGGAWRSSWRSAESDATEWISSTSGTIWRTLRLWSWPMKCQRASGWAACLRLELLGAVLAEQREPRRGERADVLGVDVLDRGRAGRRRRVARRRVARRRRSPRGSARALARTRSGLYARHTTPAWRPVTPPSRRCEKKSVARTSCTARCRGRVPTPACASRVACDARQVEVALPRARARDVGERRVDLLARPRSSSRARRGRSRPWIVALRAELAQRRDALGDDAARAARASRSAARRRRPRRRAAPAGSRRRRRARRASRERGRLAVLVGGGPCRAGRLGRAAHVGAVDLAAVEEALARASDRRGEPLAVRVDVGAVVGGQAAEVERRERALRDAAAAGGEEHARAGQLGGDVLALPAEGIGQGGIGHGGQATPRPATGEDWTIDVVVCP